VVIKNFTTTHQTSRRFLGLITMIFQKRKYPKLIFNHSLFPWKKYQITTYKTFGSFMNPDGSLRFLNNQNRRFFDSGFNTHKGRLLQNQRIIPYIVFGCFFEFLKNNWFRSFKYSRIKELMILWPVLELSQFFENWCYI
jgi:hypothetical protein